MKYYYGLHDADDLGLKGHPQEVIVGYFPEACAFRPESLGDCWFFEAPEFVGELPRCFLPCGPDGIPQWSYHEARA